VKVLIVEDEPGVAQNLCDLLQESVPGIDILAILESVDETVNWIQNHSSPDLGFFDIRLADGNSFDIFEKVEISFPVIFTTAYDEFALKAFKVNSIDYLLKPVDKKEIIRAMEKYQTLYKGSGALDYQNLMNAIKSFRQHKPGKFKKNLLVYQGDRIIPIDINSIAYFQVKNEVVYGITRQNKKHHIDQPLEKIMTQLDPESFFRANRQFIVSRHGVKSATQYFNRKLLLNLDPDPGVDVLVSKSRVTDFKTWLSG
jgi:two-component system LytT family response regulator